MRVKKSDAPVRKADPPGLFSCQRRVRACLGLRNAAVTVYSGTKAVPQGPRAQNPKPPASDSQNDEHTMLSLCWWSVQCVMLVRTDCVMVWSVLSVMLVSTVCVMMVSTVCV